MEEDQSMSNDGEKLPTLGELQSQVDMCFGAHEHITSETGKIIRMDFREFGDDDVIRSLKSKREEHSHICEYLYDRLKHCLAKTGSEGESIDNVKHYTPIVDTMTCMAYIEEAKIKEFKSMLEKIKMAKIIDDLIDRVKALESRGA